MEVLRSFDTSPFSSGVLCCFQLLCCLLLGIVWQNCRNKYNFSCFFFFFSSGFCTYLESVNSYSWRIILKKSHRLSLLLSFLVSRKCFCKHKALFSFVLSQVSGRIHLSLSLITVEKFSQEYYLACGVCCFNNINF